LSQQFADGKHLLGRLRLSVTNSPRPFDRGQLPAEVAAALATAKDKRSPEQQAALTRYFRTRDSRYQDLTSTVQKSAESLKNRRLLGVQDLAWALINNPAFLFNR
jgi:RecA-family ATPase